MVCCSPDVVWLLPKVVWALPLIVATFCRFGLEFNFSEVRLDMILAFRGVHAKSCRFKRSSEMAGRVTCDSSLRQNNIAVVHQHKHLGRICTATGAIDTEIRNRAASDMRALEGVKPLLRLGIGRKTNVMCIRLFVFSWLLYNSQTWPHLSDKNMHAVRIFT